MKCDRCGFESGLEDAFVRRRRWAIGPRRAYCPDCEARESLRFAVFAYLLLPLTAGVMYLSHPTSPWTGRLAAVSATALSFIPLILLHELGHAAAARTLGMTVAAVSLGSGRRLVSWEMAGIRWNIHLVPMGGTTQLSGERRARFRLRLWLSFLAGPAVNLLLAAFAWVWWQGAAARMGGASMSAFLASAVLYANFFLLVAALLPMKSASLYRGSGSDGWYLLRVPVLPRAELEQIAEHFSLHEAILATRRKDFDRAWMLLEGAKQRLPMDPNVANTYGFVKLHAGDLSGARSEFVEAMAMAAEASPASRYLLENNVAYVDVLLQDAELKAEAEDFSKEAYGNVPWIPAIVGTRGAVLAWHGNHAEGLAMLKRSMREAETLDSKAETACLMAIVEAESGNRYAAHSYLALAQRLDPESYMIDIAADRLNAHGPGIASDRPGEGRADAGPLTLRARLGAVRWPSVEAWAGMSLVWGVWNLIVFDPLSITPGITFVLVGVVTLALPAPGMLTALAVVCSWASLFSFSAGGAGLALGGLYFVAAVLFVLGARRDRREAGANRQDRPAIDARIPFASAALAAGSAAILAFVAMLLMALYRQPVFLDPAFLRRVLEENWQFLIYIFLIEPFAVNAASLGFASLASRTRHRGLSLAGTVIGILITLAITAVGRFP